MSDHPAYVEAWRRYRNWSRIRWIASLSLMPFMSLGAYLSYEVQEPLAMRWCFLVWALFTGIAEGIVKQFACPRCGERFSFWFHPFGRRCVSCGLPKWAKDPYADDRPSLATRR